MDLPVRDAKNVELNTASEDELSDHIGLGPERARRIMASRPFHSWDDVKRVEGLTDAIVEELKREGAELGDPARAVRIPREEEAWLRPEELDPEIRGRRL
jgi:hypothetical protein